MQPPVFSILVFDGLGNGPDVDAQSYGDQAANTIKNLVGDVERLIPRLTDLGATKPRRLHAVSSSHVSYGCIAHHRASGKGTTSGHWEMVGAVRRQDFRAIHGSFPNSLKKLLTEVFGVEPLHCAFASSGTELVAVLGEESIRSGKPIVYSSNDAVIQVAADEISFGLAQLRECAATLARTLSEEYGFGRVITRPFVKTKAHYERTGNRQDFHRPPPVPNLLSQLAAKKVPIWLYGKANEIFGGQENVHITDSYPTPERLVQLFRSERLGPRLNFYNVGHLDTLLHEQKVREFRAEIARYDNAIGQVIAELGRADWLLITADHGCDCTVSSTDNTRETCPFIVVQPRHLGQRFQDRAFLSDIPKLVCEAFALRLDGSGWEIL